MIGRKAIGNPNIFSKVIGVKERFSFWDYLKLENKYPMHFRQLKFQAMNFTKGKKNSRKLRKNIIYAKSKEEVIKLFFEDNVTTSVYNIPKRL